MRFIEQSQLLFDTKRIQIGESKEYPDFFEQNGGFALGKTREEAPCIAYVRVYSSDGRGMDCHSMIKYSLEGERLFTIEGYYETQLQFNYEARRAHIFHDQGGKIYPISGKILDSLSAIFSE